MNKKRLLFIVVLSVAVVCVGLFYWNTQRQANYAKTRELIAPVYAYSGRLTPEEQNSYIEFANALMKVDQSVAKKYGLPKRDQLQLEAHMSTHCIVTIPNYLPRVWISPPMRMSSSYQLHFGILALIAKTKLMDFPASNRSKMIQHLEGLNKRLTKNSVEAYIKKVKDLPPGPTLKLPSIAFGIQSIMTKGRDQWTMEADGSLKLPEGGKLGVVHITDIYENEFELNLDSPTDSGIIEETTELYAKIDRVFEQLTDEEFQRLSDLGKTERVCRNRKVVLFRIEVSVYSESESLSKIPKEAIFLFYESFLLPILIVSA